MSASDYYNGPASSVSYRHQQDNQYYPTQQPLTAPHEPIHQTHQASEGDRGLFSSHTNDKGTKDKALKFVGGFIEKHMHKRDSSDPAHYTTPAPVSSYNQQEHYSNGKQPGFAMQPYSEHQNYAIEPHGGQTTYGAQKEAYKSEKSSKLSSLKGLMSKKKKKGSHEAREEEEREEEAEDEEGEEEGEGSESSSSSSEEEEDDDDDDDDE
jgi:hypothetical protein